MKIIGLLLVSLSLLNCGTPESTKLSDSIYKDVESGKYIGLKVSEAEESTYNGSYIYKKLELFHCDPQLKTIPIDCTSEKPYKTYKFSQARYNDQKIYENKGLILSASIYAFETDRENLKRIFPSELFSILLNADKLKSDIEKFEAGHTIDEQSHSKYERLGYSIDSNQRKIIAIKKEREEIQKLIDFGSESQKLIERKTALNSELNKLEDFNADAAVERKKLQAIWKVVQENKSELRRLERARRDELKKFKLPLDITFLETVLIKNPKSFQTTSHSKDIAWLLSSDSKRVYMGQNLSSSEAGQEKDVKELMPFLKLIIEFSLK